MLIIRTVSLSSLRPYFFYITQKNLDNTEAFITDRLIKHYSVFKYNLKAIIPELQDCLVLQIEEHFFISFLNGMLSHWLRSHIFFIYKKLI